jgi:predicted Zn-dependent protease
MFALALAVVGVGAATASADPTKKANHKDPDGKRGISPYMESIAKGNAAFVARDLPGAVTAFQDAIKLDTDRQLGFLRLGEAQLESGKLDEAEAAWTTAQNKKGTADDGARVLFCIADLRERQHKWQAAKDAWNAYANYLNTNAKAKGYPATAQERIKQVERRMKDESDYAAVKDRIEKRQKEREQEAIENAKKDKGNK